MLDCLCGSGQHIREREEEKKRNNHQTSMLANLGLLDSAVIFLLLCCCGHKYRPSRISYTMVGVDCSEQSSLARLVSA